MQSLTTLPLANTRIAVAPGPAAVARATGRYLFIDSLRGLAALAVVLYHAAEGHHIDALASVLPGPVWAVIAHGHLGVAVFFVLSGFVIAHSMCRHDVTPGYVGRFMIRRSLRLDPPYWASMVLTVAIAVLSTRFVPGKTYDVPDVGHVMAHVFYLQGFLGITPISVVYWTLCLEIQFYLSFSLLMLLVTTLRRRRAPGAALALVLVPAVLFADLWALGMGPFHVPGLFLGFWHLFLAGVTVWWAMHRPEDRIAAPLAIANLVLLAAAGVVQADAPLLAGVMTAATIYVAGHRDKLGTWLAARPLQALGAMSYSLYLIHNPITGAAFRVGYRLTGRSLWLEAVWFVLVTGLCIAVAYVSYRLIERPSLALGHRIPLFPPVKPPRDG